MVRGAGFPDHLERRAGFPDLSRHQTARMLLLSSEQSVLVVLARLPELVQQVHLVIVMASDLLRCNWPWQAVQLPVVVVVVQRDVHQPKGLPQ